MGAPEGVGATFVAEVGELADTPKFPGRIIVGLTDRRPPDIFSENLLLKKKSNNVIMTESGPNCNFVWNDNLIIITWMEGQSASRNNPIGPNGETTMK